MLINQDPPEHTKIRQIISRGFTPRAINALHDDARRARRTRSSTTPSRRGSGDFVTEVACELPLQAIAELLGVPQEDRRKLFDWSNQMIVLRRPRVSTAHARRRGRARSSATRWSWPRSGATSPRDDIITKLVTADVDGHGSSTDDEFGYFVIMLAVAGNETTRNAITHGMNAFFEHPDQWELFKRRAAARRRSTRSSAGRRRSPSFQRTALQRRRGRRRQPIKKGERVGAVLRQRQPRRGRLRRPRHLRHHPRPEPAPRLRRPRRALLHRRQPGPARDRAHVQRDRRPACPTSAKLGEPQRLRHGWINGIKELRSYADRCTCRAALAPPLTGGASAGGSTGLQGVCADDPHREELRAAAVGVAERRAGAVAPGARRPGP